MTAPGSSSISIVSVTSLVAAVDGPDLVAPAGVGRLARLELEDARRASALVTLDVVVHDSLRLFLPLNRAPTAAPCAPSSQAPLTFSGLHSP